MANDRVKMLVEAFEEALKSFGLCAYCGLEPEDDHRLYLNAATIFDGLGVIPLQNHPSIRRRKVFCYADHMLWYLQQNPEEAVVCVPYEQTFSDPGYGDGVKGCVRCKKDNGLFLAVDGTYGTYFDSAFLCPTYFCSVKCLTDELSERIQEDVNQIIQQTNF